MTDIVLRDIDPVLAGRIRKLADQRGWDTHRVLLELLEQGLLHFESNRIARFSDGEDTAFREMLSALEQVPDSPGFGLIGQAAPTSANAPGPDDDLPSDAPSAPIHDAG